MEKNEPEIKEGIVLVSDGKSRKHPMKLQLSSERLLFFKEELVYASNIEDKNVQLQKMRTVTLHREDGEGIGISIKGGSEHHLPVLISRLFPDQAAQKCGQVFVGDAIIKINFINVEHCSHDEVVQILKNAGAIVSLTLRHFRPASYFLSHGNDSSPREDEVVQILKNAGAIVSLTLRHFRPASYFLSHGNDSSPREDEMVKINQSAPVVEKQWVQVGNLPLLHAYVSRYIPGTDKLRANAFEIHSSDGQSSALLHFDDSVLLTDWLQSIASAITILTSQTTEALNRLLLPSDQVLYLSCTQERISPTPHWQSWKARCLALRGSDVYIFDHAPMSVRDWVRCDRTYRVYESMFRVLKDTELLDGRQQCFMLQAGCGESLYMCMASRQELTQLEKAWYQTNHSAIQRLRTKTFGCSWRGRLSGLTLELDTGFSLYDNEHKTTLWQYKFSQLRGSSDDSKTKLKLHFHNDSTKQIDTREIETTSLQTLIYSIHSFLSAKLSSVDPTFLQNY